MWPYTNSNDCELFAILLMQQTLHYNMGMTQLAYSFRYKRKMNLRSHFLDCLVAKADVSTFAQYITEKPK